MFSIAGTSKGNKTILRNILALFFPGITFLFVCLISQTFLRMQTKKAYSRKKGYIPTYNVPFVLMRFILINPKYSDWKYAFIILLPSLPTSCDRGRRWFQEQEAKTSNVGSLFKAFSRCLQTSRKKIQLYVGLYPGMKLRVPV